MAATGALQRHPFPAAVEAHDIAGITNALAPDAVLVSPITSRVTFKGRDEIGKLMSSVLEILHDFRVAEDFGSGDMRAVVWNARVGNQPVEGVDVLRLDGNGKVREIRLFVRPLPGLAALAAALAPQVASRRSRLRAALAALIVGPLGPITRAGDRMVAWLARPVLHSVSASDID
jgi:hypothetical protein